MKLRFEVDQAECFRAGIDCPKSIITIEVDPKAISQEERDLIADRLIGIDVCRLPRTDDDTKHRVIAKTPTWEGLMDAIRENQKEVKE